MLLCIIFNRETIPFILTEASEDECLSAIEKAKEDYRLDRPSAIVEADRIILHAWSKAKQPTKRLYCLNDRVILQTDTKCEDEVESTRELLAYERNVDADRICVIEV